MKKSIFATLLLLCTAVMAMAQDITGTLLEKETKEPIMQTTIQLLKAADSTYVAGCVSDENGDFKVTAPADGKYIIRMTNVGYKTITRNITIAEGKPFAFGKINMETDAVLLKEVVANGVAAKVIVKEDTFIYNAAAYRTPEGSVIEELVKRLPGAQIDDDGKITINGKQVKKVKVDGKEFMTGDTQTALKNLPTAIIDKIKAYDEKSDLAKMTGIDDGNESTVLDFGIKQGMNKGTMVNVDLAAGTKSRYAERLMGAYMKDNMRVMMFGNANNVGDRGFSSGGRGGGGGGNGLQATKMLGFNFNYEIKDKLNTDFSLRWNHSDSDNQTLNASENFISRSGSFSNNKSTTYGRSNSWNISGRLEWKPDTLTTIAFRPSVSISSSDSRAKTTNASFNQDPYSFGDNIDPLDSIQMRTIAMAHGLDSLMVNRSDNKTLSYSTNKNVNLEGTFSRQLSSKGRNITLQARYSSGNSDSENLSSQLTHLYLLNDSTYYRNRYNVTPGNNWSYTLSAVYSEPIWVNRETKNANYLQLRYQYQYRNTTSDRSTHDFSQKTPYIAGGISGSDFGSTIDLPTFRNFGEFLDPYLSMQNLSGYKIDSLCRFSEYNNYIHEIELTLRRTTDKYNLNAGVMLQPQNSKLHYKYLNQEYNVSRSVTNLTPTFDFRYRWTRQKSLRLNYRGNTSQPSMTDLLDIYDDSNPLNISRGNSELKPSFTQSFRLQYNNYVQNHMRTIMSFINYSNTSNSISNMVTYNDVTGGRTTQPQNINGNWNVSGALMFNTAIDTTGVWNMSSMTNVNYNNHVSYVTLAKTDANGQTMKVNGITQYDDPTKNYTRSTSLNERLGFSYRNSWLEVELNGSLTYTITRNKLQPNSNLDTWQFQYGTDITATAPWGMSFSTGTHMSSRRGYSSAEANTNEFIWNAQIAQSFLKGKPLTVSLQFYDILNQKSSFSRNISANQRRDTWYNSINNYAMLHVIYRFNAFGGRAGREAMRGQRGQGRPEGGPGGERGGFGGGRGGFGGGGFGGGGGFRGRM